MSSDEDISIEDISSSDNYVNGTEIKKNILPLTFPMHENEAFDIIPKEKEIVNSNEKPTQKAELTSGIKNIVDNLFASDSDSDSANSSDNENPEKIPNTILNNDGNGTHQNIEISFSDSHSSKDNEKNDDVDIYIEDMNQHSSENNIAPEILVKSTPKIEDQNDFSSNSFDEDFASSEGNNSFQENQFDKSINHDFPKSTQIETINSDRPIENSDNHDNQILNRSEIDSKTHENSISKQNEENEIDEHNSIPEEKKSNFETIENPDKKENKPTSESHTKKVVPKNQYSIDDADAPVFNWLKNDKPNQSNNKPKKNQQPIQKPRQVSPTKPTTNKSHQSNMFITQVTSAVKQVDEERQKRVLEEEKRRKRIEAARRQKEEEDRKRIKQEEERIRQYEKQKQLEEQFKQDEMEQLETYDIEDEGGKNKKLMTKPKVYQQRTRMNFAIMQFAGISPSIPVTKQINLSKYDYDDFDVSLADNIPEGLFPLLKHGHESIVFRTLCGVSISKYPKGVISRVLIELNKYLDLCVEKGLITEASYVNAIIENVKNERTEKKKQTENSIEKVNEKLQEAEEQFEKKKNNWENQKSIMQVDKQLQDEDLELRYQEESVKLDDEWNSEKMQQKFNKPSPMLIELRQQARSLLAAHRFDEAAQVAEEIAKKEAEETEEAARRMSQAYQAAVIRLREKFDQEKEAIDVQYQTKYSALIKAEEASLRPVSQRIDKYKNIKEDHEMAARRSKTSYGRPKTTRKPVVVKSKHAPIVFDAKLKLPPLAKMKMPKRDTRSALSEKM